MNRLKRILLVEDSELDIEMTLRALAGHRLANEVAVARDGVEALDYLLRRGAHAGRAEGHPVVILLDNKMPRMSGLELLAILSADDELRHIPVVMLTSSREEGDLVKSYALGANAYVVKPVEFQAFVAAVQELCLFWGLLNTPPPGSVRSL
ncbi:MAG: response regulator [Planctomycetes bacterium]|nr:response regulator [Planctomycetota bacterium]